MLQSPESYRTEMEYAADILKRLAEDSAHTADSTQDPGAPVSTGPKEPFNQK